MSQGSYRVHHFPCIVKNEGKTYDLKIHYIRSSCSQLALQVSGGEVDCTFNFECFEGLERKLEVDLGFTSLVNN